MQLHGLSLQHAIQQMHVAIVSFPHYTKFLENPLLKLFYLHTFDKHYNKVILLSYFQHQLLTNFLHQIPQGW